MMRLERRRRKEAHLSKRKKKENRDGFLGDHREQKRRTHCDTTPPTTPTTPTSNGRK